MRDPMVTELRVLDGRHAGACAAAHDGLLVGAGEDAEVILTDLAPDAGLARLHLLEGGRWLLWPAAQSPDEEARAKAPHLGVARHWGGLALCVSAPHSDWPSLAQAQALSAAQSLSRPDAPGTILPGEAPAPERAPALAPVAAEDGARPQPVAQPGARHGASRLRSRGGWALAAVLLALLVVAAVIVWWRGAAPAAASASFSAQPVDRTAEARRQLPALQLAIARVDPGLRLQLTPRADGRVLVQGWSDSLAQFDRLAKALAAERPLPLMRVRVAGELRAELGALMASSHPQLEFTPDGPMGVRVSGIVLDAQARAEALAAVRAVLPRELEMVDGLRLAEQMALEVKGALVAAGFTDARAHWDGGQVLANVALAPNARGRLEYTLVKLVERLRGLPLRVVAEPWAPVRQSARGPAPFPIRGVVSGAVSYLVLPDGERVQPGGTHAGWRLQSIEPEVLVFDAPRRLEVAR